MPSKLYISWERAFLISLAVAALLHAGGFFALNLLPRNAVVELPVRILNVKLGGEEMLDHPEVLVKSPAPSGNTQPIESTLAKQFTPATKAQKFKDGALQKLDKKSPEKATETLQKTVQPQATATVAPLALPNVAKEYVREQSVPESPFAPAGNPLGNNPKAKETLIKGYTQAIALWIEKFKIYPAQARQQGMEGTAMVRIRLDRRGNIHYYILSRRTPYPLLDRAVLDMVRRANPVPAVPADYPMQDEFLEFVVPITFRLNQ